METPRANETQTAPESPRGITRTLWSLESNRQRLDGGAMFGSIPRALWSRWITPDARHRIPLATRCLLIEERPTPTLSLLHLSEPTRQPATSYAVSCSQKKKHTYIKTYTTPTTNTRITYTHQPKTYLRTQHTNQSHHI